MAIHVGLSREYIVECESTEENINSLLGLRDSEDYDVWCCVDAQPWHRFDNSTVVTIRFFEWNKDIEKDVLDVLSTFEK